MVWSNNQLWMLSGDDKGYIKYWQANMNNVKMVQGHFEIIRGLRYKNHRTKTNNDVVICQVFMLLLLLLFLPFHNTKL